MHAIIRFMHGIPRSPFRYPGGKSRKLNLLTPLLNPKRAYSDPFTGGGSVSLAVAQRFPSIDIYLNDVVPGVAAVWELVASSSDTEFAAFCGRFSVVPTVDLFLRIKSLPDTFDADGAFRTLFLNRTSYGGLLHGGPIGGLNQTGAWKIGCQYSAETTIARLEKARKVLSGGRTVVTCGDWRDAIFDDTVFIDPPYIGPGNALYSASMTLGDHSDLAAKLIHHDFVATYDDTPFVRELYAWADILSVDYTYSSTSSSGACKWKAKTEILVSNNAFTNR